ncbi:MAG TPA: DUF3854 domain-containing protein [Pyrinomonadaceae bacterium]|nr:DUF3854 domain-containing protein [Pyrinomonadaceae bacterium]
MNSNYKRVSLRRTCLICGKPDWCSFTPDGRISFCARICDGADRVSRTGWGVFYHEKSLFPSDSMRAPHRPPPIKVKLAPLEIRDFAYRKLIELAPARADREIVDGPNGLRARKIFDLENYGSLPRTRAERTYVAKQIRSLINRKFPDFVRCQKSSIAGLPGFWLDRAGRIQLWSDKDYECSMMLIPYLSMDGFIQACQIRFMKPDVILNGIRYVWLSTPAKHAGLTSGSPIHFASYDGSNAGKPILITEGALKAETSKSFFWDCNVIASAGIACSHDSLVAAIRSRQIFIAFDTDFYVNHFVALAMVRLINLIVLTKKICRRNQIKILSWDTAFKGIDEALLQNATIIQQTPAEWFNSLSQKCRDDLTQTIPDLLIASVK